MRKYTLLLLTLIISTFTNVVGQEIGQTIRGQVINADNDKPLIGATVDLVEVTEKQVITDSKGEFRLENIPIGRYNLKVSYVGYKTIILSEILVEATKEVVKTIALQPGAENLEEVVVTGERPVVNQLSTQMITVEQTQRYAATFYDPARLATSFAGVINYNDQGNTLIVRGNSPNTTVWRLEGVDIVNPNHTPNAGTFTDRVTSSGGGVNILSTQLLGDSYFLKGAYPAEYGNALGGILDMRLRQGNNQQHEFTGQVSLIGLDFAAEGPFSKNSEAAYLVNYRYSTIGLLSAMGVKVGDESISFQDFAVNLTLPTKNIGMFTAFGMWGQSENIFEANLDSTTWEVQKDRQDISFDARMYALGLTHTLSIGENAIWRTVVARSNLKSNRTARFYETMASSRLLQIDDHEIEKDAITSALSYKINDKNRLKVGVFANQVKTAYLSFFYFSPDTLNQRGIGQTENWLWQPYANYQLQLSPRFIANLGLHYLYYELNGSQSLEPRFSFNWRLNGKNALHGGYGLYSQLQPVSIYYAANEYLPQSIVPDLPNRAFFNTHLDFTKAHHYTLNYENKFNRFSKIGIELYYQDIYNVPIEDDPTSTFSALNVVEESVQTALVNAGTGRNYGLELTVEQLLHKSYYYLITATLYESKYTGGDGIERDTRFSGNYALALTGGKEFQWNTKKGSDKILGINLKLNYVGGFLTAPIDVSASRVAGRTIYIEEQAFTIRQSDYFKIDLRLYYKLNKSKNFNSTLALDIQNLTNARNFAFDYFDAQVGAVVTKYQLGIIPILTYRMEF